MSLFSQFNLDSSSVYRPCVYDYKHAEICVACETRKGNCNNMPGLNPTTAETLSLSLSLSLPVSTFSRQWTETQWTEPCTTLSRSYTLAQQQQHQDSYSEFYL